MPAKKTRTEDQEKHQEGVLAGAAKAIGGLAGKVAAAVGGTGTATAQSAKAKLPKKSKSRLPRRQKKEMKKKAAASAV